MAIEPLGKAINPDLIKKCTESLINDAQLNALRMQMQKLIDNAPLKYILTTGGNYERVLSAEFNEAKDQIELMITHRENQILGFYGLGRQVLIRPIKQSNF